MADLTLKIDIGGGAGGGGAAPGGGPAAPGGPGPSPSPSPSPGGGAPGTPPTLTGISPAEAGKMLLQGQNLGNTGDMAKGISSLLSGGKAGIMSEATMMAGPEVALAVQAAEMIGEKVVGSIKAMSSGVKFAGEVGVSMAQNDYTAVINKAGEAVAGFAEQLGLVGKVYAEYIRLVLAVGNAFKDVTDAFITRGRELAKFSGELALAGAQADVRRMMGDIREAQRLGPAIAELTDAQSKFYDEVRLIMLPIEEVVVDFLAYEMRGLANTLTGIRRWLNIQDAAEGNALLSTFMEMQSGRPAVQGNAPVARRDQMDLAVPIFQGQ